LTAALAALQAAGDDELARVTSSVSVDVQHALWQLMSALRV
jgi:hypothetical protein